MSAVAPKADMIQRARACAASRPSSHQQTRSNAMQASRQKRICLRAKYRVDPHQFRIIRMKIFFSMFHGSKGHGPRRRRGSRYANFVGSVSEHDRDLGADHRHFVNSSSSAALSAQSSDVAFYWINQLGACRSAGAVGRCRYGWRSLPRISLLPD